MKFLATMVATFAVSFMLACSNQQANQDGTDIQSPAPELAQSAPFTNKELAEASEQLQRALADSTGKQPLWRAELEGRKEAVELQMLRDSFERIDDFFTRWEGKIDFAEFRQGADGLAAIRVERANKYASTVIFSLNADLKGIYFPNGVGELENAIRVMESADLAPADLNIDITAGDLRQLLLREIRRHIDSTGLAPDPDGNISDAGGILHGYMREYNFTPEDLGFTGKDAEALRGSYERYHSGEGGH